MDMFPIKHEVNEHLGKCQASIQESSGRGENYKESYREIVSIQFLPTSQKWGVRSNYSLTTAKFDEVFDSFGLAYKEYFKRIYEYLDYKHPTPFRFEKEK